MFLLLMRINNKVLIHDKSYIDIHWKTNSISNPWHHDRLYLRPNLISHQFSVWHLLNYTWSGTGWKTPDLRCNRTTRGIPSETTAYESVQDKSTSHCFSASIFPFFTCPPRSLGPTPADGFVYGLLFKYKMGRKEKNTVFAKWENLICCCSLKNHQEFPPLQWDVQVRQETTDNMSVLLGFS